LTTGGMFCDGLLQLKLMNKMNDRKMIMFAFMASFINDLQKILCDVAGCQQAIQLAFINA
jgi:hypothetical protein